MKISKRKDWTRPSDSDAWTVELEDDVTRPLALNLQETETGPVLAIRSGGYQVDLDWQDLDFLRGYLDERRLRHIQAFAKGARKVKSLADRILDNVKPEGK